MIINYILDDASLSVSKFFKSSSRLLMSSILAPSLLAWDGSVCVSKKIPSILFTIPALARDSIYSGFPPVTPDIWFGLCTEWVTSRIVGASFFSSEIPLKSTMRSL